MALASPFLVVVSILVAMNYFRESGLHSCLDEIKSNIEKEQIQALAGLAEDVGIPDGDLKKCNLWSCKRLENGLQSFQAAIRPATVSSKCGSGSTEITLFMPITTDKWIFAMVGPDRTYSDIRNPKNSIGFSSVGPVLEEAEEQPFVDFGFKVLESLSFGSISTSAVAVALENDEGKKFAAIVGQRI